MSLIYRALKSLQASRVEDAGETRSGTRPRPRTRVQRLRHRLVSPGLVVITAGLMVIAGVGMVLGVEWLVEQSRRVEPRVARHAPVQDPPAASAARADREKPGPQGPPAPESAGAAVTFEPVPPPPAPFEAPAPPPLEISGEGGQLVERAAAPRPGMPAEPARAPVFVPPAEPAAEVAFIAPPPAPAAADRLPSLPADRPADPATAAPQAEHGGDGSPPDAETALRLARQPVAPSAGTHQPAGAAVEDDVTASPAAGDGTASPPAVSMRIRRQARFAQAARELRAALAAGRGAVVEEQFARIARLKGENNPFLLKMRAYWDLRNQRYDRAETILARLLELQPGDLETQLNMAVLEAHTGRRAAASARLADLAARFPGEARVTSMAAMLN